ncbi:Hydroxymethylpyrimidine phosphate kinase ThiD [Alkalibacterium sp. AK22]|uniref:bifunctional hydroxymethylpyrimidine kinase/phosphomethylpyrimidine kinase n=1 Tax=Alkalibacterium sp. AK22 TaxID=1229520 RepID=UPI00044BF260|nr:bifunctional hydroxymethylpyrimidine kinase/phosphomethylpyrimidine kinase [Alkalibacterium sp. AK22]EXJ24063.1 Hydroxymethylpyrimidine phosphate kinase ThiD [Alkalibacterium sp. AK22]
MTNIPEVLTIAGSDSGGGAGIQADLKTFQEQEVFGMSIITAVTAQNTTGVQGVHPVPLVMVKEQWDSIFADFNVKAMKTGMLVNGDYMKLIAAAYRELNTIPLVIDPVMIAKGGHPLMEEQAIAVMRDELAPLATVITPNIPEAEALTDMKIETKQDMREAAKRLHRKGSKNVVIKGGHAMDKEQADDLLLLEDGKEIWLSAQRIDTQNTHGTGCTFAACITAELGKGKNVEAAVRTAKAFILAAIRDSLNIGQGHGPTNHWAYNKEKK